MRTFLTLNRWPRLALLAWLICTGAATAEEVSFDGRRLLASAVTTDVQITDDSKALVLGRGELIEDDGPAAGYSYQPNEERISKDVWARKDLLIPDPRCHSATLLIGGSGDLTADVNGTTVDLKNAEKAGNYWRAVRLPADVLRAGENRVILRGSGKVWIAREADFAAGSRSRKTHPNRSARSTDGGRTWDDQRLGLDGSIDGEYYVRIFLDRHPASGAVLLPIVDAGNLGGKPLAAPVTTVGPVRVRVAAAAGQAGRVAVRVRSGPTLSPGEHWSKWQDLSAEGGTLAKPDGRFVQVAIDLSTDDPRQSPRLNEVKIEATPIAAGDWTRDVKVIGQHNEQIMRSSIPFEYEPFDHPRLKDLRERHRLDDVVAGAKGDFAIICRLAKWASEQWTRGHLRDAYPAWDATEILKPHADGTPVGGFCQQYNVVLLQACESFGIPGRAVSLSPGALNDKPRRSGHEVVELWSNEHRKWVYVDGQFAWYAVDADTGTPLSLLELRGRQLVALGVMKPPFPPPVTRIVHLAAPPEGPQNWTGLDAGVPFGELRLIPRSNFLQSAAPLPLNQGMRGWFWTGHYVWTDEALPAALLYGHRVTSPTNWEWSLNQASYALEATATPGEVRVHLDTQTPGFDTYLASIDGGEAKPVTSGFTWKLHPGRNRLEVRPRNVAGVEGISSWIELDRP